MGIFKKHEEDRREPERIKEIEGDLECEEAIIQDKARFGRTRNSLMKGLRVKYGEKVANRALWRVNRRLSDGYMIGSDHEEAEVKAVEVLKRLLDKKDLIERSEKEAKEKAESDEEGKDRKRREEALKPINLEKPPLLDISKSN